MKTSNDDEDSDIQTDLLDSFLTNHPRVVAQLLTRLDMLESKNDISKTNDRSKRRVSVFNNVYHQCRIQKRKEKNLCLYLANLYQNLKGFHGL